MDIAMPDLGFTWAEVIEMLSTTGVEFGINLVTAIVIFVIGRWITALLVRALRKVMRRQEIDKRSRHSSPTSREWCCWSS